MKKTILATLISAAFLAGCSSNGSSNNTPDPEPKQGIADVVYSEELRSAAIIGDEGNNALIIADGNSNAAITVNGDTFTVQGDQIVNDQGDTVGSVYTEDGVATAYINDVAYTLTVVEGRLIVDSSKLNPPNPDNDLPGKDKPVIDKPVDNENPLIPFTHNGVDLVLDTTTGLITNDGVVVASFTRDGYITGTVIDDASGNEYKIWKDATGINVDWINSDVDSGWDHVLNPFIPFTHNGFDLVLDTTTGLITDDGVVVASFVRDGYITGTVIDHATGNEYKIWKDANGINVDWINSDVDSGIDGPNKMPKLTAEQKLELKDRVKALSAEQRQQIKQAIQTRLQTRS